jgi:hypothetical protein
VAGRHLAIISAVIVLASGLFLWTGGAAANAATIDGWSFWAKVSHPLQSVAVPDGPGAEAATQQVPLGGEGWEGWGVGSIRVWAGVRTPGGIIPEEGVCFETGMARACTDASGWGQFFLSSGMSGQKYYDIGLLRTPGSSRYLCRVQRPMEYWDQEFAFGVWDSVHAKILVTGDSAARFVCVRLPAEGS